MTAMVATDPVEEHVAALDRALSGPAEVRRGVVREVRDGLLDAAEAYRRGGVDAHRAARLAVRDFGPVDEIAPLYQDELAAGQGRRTAQLLVVGVPGLVLGWDVLVSTGFSAGPRAPAAVAVLAWALAYLVSAGVPVLMNRSALRTFRALRVPAPC